MGVLMAVLGGLPPGIPLLDQRALTARWFVDKDFDFVIKHLNGARRTAATAPYRVFAKIATFLRSLHSSNKCESLLSRWDHSLHLGVGRLREAGNKLAASFKGHKGMK